MNIKKYLKENDISLKTMSEITTIPYTTLSDIVNEKVDLYECKYKTLKKLSLFLKISIDDLVYEKEDFQTFRNNLHHEIKNSGLLEVAADVLQRKRIDYYYQNDDIVKALYLLSLVDYVCRINEIALCEDYANLRNKKLKEPFYVGDLVEASNPKYIMEFKNHNIYEGELTDAV